MDPLILTVFVCGHSPPTTQAMIDLPQSCALLQTQCTIEFIDIQQPPQAALTANIVATPTLVRQAPLPQCRIAGNLSDTTALLLARPHRLASSDLKPGASPG